MILALAFILIFALLLFIALLFSFMVFDLFLELPYVATQRKKIETIIKFANIKKGETVVDLGSGDGRLLIESAKRGAVATGYEINPFMIAISMIHRKLEGFENQIEIRKESLWKADLAVADVVFVYAKRISMKKFEDFIYKNSKKGTRIVVNTNPFPNKKAENEENRIFLFKV